MTTPKSKTGLHILASDEMFKVGRREGHPRASERVLTFDQEQVLRLRYLEDYLLEQDWPKFDAQVLVDPEDEYAWAYMPEEWEDALAAEGISRDVEVPAQVKVWRNIPRIEKGLNFIKRRVPPLEPDYWLVEEAHLIRRMLDADEPEDKLRAVEALTRLRDQAGSHAAYLPAVRKKSAQERRLRDPGQEANKKRALAAAAWKEEAVSIVAASTYTGTNLINHVNKKLAERGFEQRHPATIRKAIRNG